MYGIFNYIWVIYGVNVSKYAIHGSYGSSILKLSVVRICCSPSFFAAGSQLFWAWNLCHRSTLRSHLATLATMAMGET